MTTCQAVTRQEVQIRNTVLPPTTGRIREGPRGEETPPANLPESFTLESRPTMGQVRGLTRDNPETNPITTKLRTACHVESKPPGLPWPPALRPGALPYKVSCFVSSRVSLDNSFLSVGQAHSLGPWKGSPVLQPLCPDTAHA